jgi:CDP-diacylglycerol--glycerol-3-phosphate 3-phosphatidyltransferase
MLIAPIQTGSESEIDAGGPSSLPSVDYAARRLRDTVWSSRAGEFVYRLLTRLGTNLSRLGVSADAITWLSIVLAGAAALSIGFGQFVPGAVLVALSGSCDAIDGAVARASGTSTRYGALLDSTMDRVADGLPLLGIMAFYAGSPLVLVPACAMMTAFLVSYVRARTESLGAALPPLFMRRAERLVALLVALLVAPLEVMGAPMEAPLLLVGVTVLGATSGLGGIWALRTARQALAGPHDDGVDVSSLRGAGAEELAPHSHRSAPSHPGL